MSVTVTLAKAVLAFAVPGVPSIAPLAVSMPSPGGSPVASWAATSTPPLGFIAAIGTPTVSELGAV